jgi:CheY-like chemotaxis protein
MTKQVIVADDNPELRRMYTSVFEMMKYNVLGASDGSEVLTLLESNTPDLMLLDVNMPEYTGLEVLYMVRQDPKFQDTKIILLTGNVTVLDQPETALANLICVKPINIPDLMTSIKKLMS